jgi:hypothetical protein
VLAIIAARGLMDDPDPSTRAYHLVNGGEMTLSSAKLSRDSGIVSRLWIDDVDKTVDELLLAEAIS